MSRAEIAVLYPCGTAVRGRVWAWFGKAVISADDSTGKGCPLHGIFCKPFSPEAKENPQ